MRLDRDDILLGEGISGDDFDAEALCVGGGGAAAAAEEEECTSARGSGMNCTASLIGGTSCTRRPDGLVIGRSRGVGGPDEVNGSTAGG